MPCYDERNADEQALIKIITVKSLLQVLENGVQVDEDGVEFIWIDDKDKPFALLVKDAKTLMEKSKEHNIGVWRVLIDDDVIEFETFGASN